MKKIMFNDRYGLTESVLSGRKTQTRRIIPKYALEKVDKFMVDYHNATFDVLTEMEALQQYFFIENIGKLPFKVGEVVAIAQSYKDCGYGECAPIVSLDENGIATFGSDAGSYNKMFVKADLMPHRIRITNVRVERLQDISDEDCIKEGIEWDHKAQRFYVRYDSKKHSRMWFANSPRESYSALIDSISGKGTWDSTPYVFVYDFELVK